MIKQLFIPFDYKDNGIIKTLKKENKKYHDPFFQEIYNCLNFTDKYQSPVVKPYLGEIPHTLLGFNRRK